jgi:uncharacterized protein YlxW (UPF0749 family)
MNQFEFVLAIIFLAFAFSLVRHRMMGSHKGSRELRDEPTETAETQRLRGEVSELKERIKVLERITVEKENSLAREIESLRER